MPGIGSYVTTKRVRIHDFRLQSFYLGLCFVIALYSFFMLLLMHTHVSYETPTATLNIWEGGKAKATTVESRARLCYNSSYDFGWKCQEESDPSYSTEECAATRQVSNGWLVRNASCASFDEKRLLTVRPASARIVTHRSFIPWACTGPDTDPLTCPREYFPKDRHSVLYDDAEDFFILLLHTPETSAGTKLQPITELRDKAGNVWRTYPTGLPIGFGVTMADWMRLAGSSLDDINRQSWAGPDDQPRYRTTGAMLIVRMTYTNYRPGEVDSTLKCVITVEHSRAQWGYGGSVEVPGTQTVASDNGVIFNFVVQGQIGRSDLQTTLTFLLNSVVMISLATFVTDCIGRWLLTERAHFNASVFDVHQDLRGKAREATEMNMADGQPDGQPDGTEGTNPL